MPPPVIPPIHSHSNPMVSTGIRRNITTTFQLTVTATMIVTMGSAVRAEVEITNRTFPKD